MGAERDKALDRIGRRLFGQAWIGAISKTELQLAKRYEDQPLPAAPDSAARVALARFRKKAGSEQFGQVLDWWAERGGETMARHFEQSEFDALFAGIFGTESTAISPIERRQRAVQRALRACTPGRGGNTSWKKFCGLVNGHCRGNWDEKTIRRDVRATSNRLSR